MSEKIVIVVQLIYERNVSRIEINERNAEIE
jgi:hypothetical protein